MKRVVIVGGVAGGASAAARLRRLNEDLEIIIFEKGSYVSFANCGLPYHIGEVIQNRESLLLQTPESLKARFNIDVRVNSEVIEVNSSEKKIKVKMDDGREMDEKFDFLILAPGAKPLVPNIKGIENSKILTLRNMNDMDKIKEKLGSKNIKRAVVVGGGYVGVETAENISHLGITTTLIEAAPNILAPFDGEMVNILEYEIVNSGINLMTREKVIEFREKNRGIEIILESNKVVETDIVILAIGVIPDTKFLSNSGVLLGEKGHILVNDKLETNIPGIYAVGDAILVKNYITNESSAIPLAGPANRQGRIVAGNIENRNEKYKGSLGTAIIKVFGLTGASTGLNERAVKRLNISYERIYLHPNDHASYYPGATPISIKLIYEKGSGKILGAQVIGIKGVDKFIDVIATTIKFGGKLEDLAELELAYAPPFSSAKSPINMAGFVGLNLEEGLVEQIVMEDLKNYDKNKQIILDVREEVEVATGKIDNSINIPLSELRKRFIELPKDKEILIYCAVGLRGYIASRFLLQNGYRVKNIAGGIKSKIKDIHFIDKSNNQNKIESASIIEGEYLDLSGLSCPGPLVKIKERIDNLKEEEILKVKVSDPGFYNDIQSWCKTTKNSLLSFEKKNGYIFVILKKSGMTKNNDNKIIETKDGVTIK